MLEIKLKEIAAGRVAYLQGVADEATSPQLLRSLLDVIESHPAHLVVVMDGVEFIDSRGLGALVGAYHKALESGCRFSIVASDPQIQRVMQVTGLNKVIALCPTEERALEMALAE